MLITGFVKNTIRLQVFIISDFWLLKKSQISTNITATYTLNHSIERSVQITLVSILMIRCKID